MLPLVGLGAVYTCAQGVMNAAAAGVNLPSRNRRQMRQWPLAGGNACQADAIESVARRLVIMTW